MSLVAQIITNKFYIDEFYTLVIEKPYKSLSEFFFKGIETNILNPIIDGIGNSFLKTGDWVRKIQQGNMSFYFFAMIAGILLFLIFILII